MDLMDPEIAFKDLKNIMADALPYSDLKNLQNSAKSSITSLFQPALEALFDQGVVRNRHPDSDAAATVFAAVVPFVQPEIMKNLFPAYLEKIFRLARQAPLRDELSGEIKSAQKPEDRFCIKHRKNILRIAKKLIGVAPESMTFPSLLPLADLVIYAREENILDKDQKINGKRMSDSERIGRTETLQIVALATMIEAVSKFPDAGTNDVRDKLANAYLQPRDGRIKNLRTEFVLCCDEAFCKETLKKISPINLSVRKTGSLDLL